MASEMDEVVSIASSSGSVTPMPSQQSNKVVYQIDSDDDKPLVKKPRDRRESMASLATPATTQEGFHTPTSTTPLFKVSSPMAKSVMSPAKKQAEPVEISPLETEMEIDAKLDAKEQEAITLRVSLDDSDSDDDVLNAFSSLVDATTTTTRTPRRIVSDSDESSDDEEEQEEDDTTSSFGYDLVLTQKRMYRCSKWGE